MYACVFHLPPLPHRHLAHKDCGTRYAPAKLLGVLYPSRHTINDMVSDVLKQPYFHMVALHTDGKVATGVDGKLAVGTVTFGDLARVNPRPSLSAVFHTLMDALETSEGECLHHVFIYEQHTLGTLHRLHQHCNMPAQHIKQSTS